MENIAWMAWTLPTAIFFALLACTLAVMTCLAVAYPEAERVAIFGYSFGGYYSSRIAAQSRDWYPIEVPLDRAAVERVHISRWPQHDSASLNPASPGNSRDFLIGSKPSIGDSRKGLARCQWDQVGPGK